MNNKKWLIVLFVAMVLAQFAVPLKMIFDRENVLVAGKNYKFKTAPIDPSDPFRGKYVTLSFAENTFEVSDNEKWHNGQSIYVLLKTDKDGFAKIADVVKETPAESNDYVKAKLNYVVVQKDSTQTIHQLNIEYPFNRFYMEESKAPLAESMYWELARDTTKIAYASVSVQNGNAVLKDVFINDVSIKDLVKAERLK
jgi:uncharacterized membrane-anchored protein